MEEGVKEGPSALEKRRCGPLCVPFTLFFKNVFTNVMSISCLTYIFCFVKNWIILSTSSIPTFYIQQHIYEISLKLLENHILNIFATHKILIFYTYVLA